MNAVISGQAGVAILVNGPELASIHAGRGGEVIERRPEEVRFLLGDARDLEFIEDIDVQEVSRRLEVATTKYDAFHIALILLDESLSLDTRREAAEELEELLEYPEVADFPERVLFSHPFPRGADPSGARACCTVRTPKVRNLLGRLAALQPLIAEVHEAWARIPDSAFSSTGDRSHAQATFVREGLVRDLVQTLADRGSIIDIFLAQVRWNKAVQQAHREILREWIYSLQKERKDTTDNARLQSCHGRVRGCGSGQEMHALLIGVGHYFPNKLSDGGSYPSLDGAARDIERVETFLRDDLKVAQERIHKLAITATPEGTPPEPQETWPTYENMVKAFQRLAEEIEPEDEVYIHYSGHGGRTPTLCRNKESEVDSCLVPCDIGNSAARYLRDVELSRLLQMIAAKKPRMTVVLDCCHSGGAARGRGGAVNRGRSTIDTTSRPEESLVGSWDDLQEEWQSVNGTNGATKRNLSVQSWMPRSDSYVLFAASRPQESAYEYPFENDESQGALTYWLLDTLRRSGPGVSCRELQDRLMAKIHTRFCYQTPMLLGNPERAFLGGNSAGSWYAINVIRMLENAILLNVGRVQGVREGTRLAIEAQGKVVLVEIYAAGATESWARLVNATRDNILGSIKQGAQAVLLQPGQIELQSAVELVWQDGLPSGIDQDAALEAVRRALGSQHGFVHLAAEGESVNFQVAVNAAGEYEIWDSAGQDVPHLRPPLLIDDLGASAALVRRLVHLTRFRNVQALENFDEQSPLLSKLRFEVVGVQSDYTPGEKPSPQPVESMDGGVDLEYGEWLFVKLANRSSRALNVAVLDLQPDWGISQSFPGKNDAPFWPLEPGEERLLRIRGILPEGHSEGTDILKAVGTLGSPDLRWLELPALDQPPPAIGKHGNPADPLQQLFASLGARPPAKRHLNPSVFGSEEWGTAQLEVRVWR